MIRTLLAAALTFTAVTGTPTPADDMEEPFGPQCAELAPQGQNGFAALADQPVATAISEIPQLSTLDTAVREAELTERLNEADDITVFAPTDEAFAAIPRETLDEALADRQQLVRILTHHVVEGEKAPDDLAGEHTTLEGGRLNVQGEGEEFTVNGANVVCGDIQTENARLYVIDQVLLPQ